MNLYEENLGWNKDFQITKNFHLSEFHSKDGERVPVKYLANVVYVAQQLQTLRNLLGGCTIYINSAYRSYQHNVKVGGAQNSNHKLGRAVDIRTQKYTAKQLHSKMLEYMDNDYIPTGELILYPTFVHYAPAYSHNHNKIYQIEPFTLPHEML